VLILTTHDAVAELPASKPKPVVSKGVRAESYPGSSPKALDVHIRNWVPDAPDEVIKITSDMTVGEVEAMLTAKTKLDPGQLSLVLDEDDPKNGNALRTPFLTPVGQAIDRRAVPKGSTPMIITHQVYEGFSESKTSVKGGGAGKSAAIAGTFGSGAASPVDITTTVGANFTKNSTWSVSKTRTFTRSKEISWTLPYDAGYVTQYYQWAIMIPDENNVDRLFTLPAEGKTTFRDYKGPEQKTVEEINDEQVKNCLTVKPRESITTAPTPKPKVWFRLKNKDGNYLSCPGNAINTRKPLYIHQKHESQSGQMWSIEPIEGQGDNAGVRIKSRLTYKGKSYYMCVYSGKTNNGAQIGVWQQAGVSSQAWTLGKDYATEAHRRQLQPTPGYITHARSKRVLSSYKTSRTGGHSILWYGKDTTGQTWELEYVE